MTTSSAAMKTELLATVIFWFWVSSTSSSSFCRASQRSPAERKKEEEEKDEQEKKRRYRAHRSMRQLPSALGIPSCRPFFLPCLSSLLRLTFPETTKQLTLSRNTCSPFHRNSPPKLEGSLHRTLRSPETSAHLSSCTLLNASSTSGSSRATSLYRCHERT